MSRLIQQRLRVYPNSHAANKLITLTLRLDVDLVALAASLPVRFRARRISDVNTKQLCKRQDHRLSV